MWKSIFWITYPVSGMNPEMYVKTWTAKPEQALVKQLHVELKQKYDGKNGYVAHLITARDEWNPLPAPHVSTGSGELE